MLRACFERAPGRLFRLLCASGLMLLAGCGGSAGGNEGGVQAPPPVPTIDLLISGQAITKTRAAGGIVAFLQERLTSLFEAGPQRTLEILQDDGHTTRAYVAPAGWSIVDFAIHPGGDVSVVLTTAKEVRLVRLNRAASIELDEAFLDPGAATDPFFDYEGGVRDASSLQPVLMHDAARLVSIGDSLVLVLRTGLNAVVAYRLDLDATGEYRRAWRTLVEPGSSILGVGITSGTFDTFGQLQNHLLIHVDVDAAGTLAIGLVDAPFLNSTFRAHAEYFGEPVAASMGVLVDRVDSRDGRRVGSTAIDTHVHAELHGLRATPSGFALVGRVFSEARAGGTGWNAFAAFVLRDGAPGAYSVIDVDRGDLLFDIAALPDGRYVGVGTTGYTQNPAGASISESAQPLLLLLNADGSLARNIGFPGGLRHNQLDTVESFNGQWLVGGMTNGPGTHSGDSQPALIVADGFLRVDPDIPVQ
jgi:hypothetical protein